MKFSNKLVAIAYMSWGLGGAVGKGDLFLDTYIDANENSDPLISQMPYRILRAKGREIRKTIQAVRENNIQRRVRVF